MHKDGHPIVCLACLGRQRDLLHCCDKCGSRRLIHVEFLKQTYGENWRELLEADKVELH